MRSIKTLLAFAIALAALTIGTATASAAIYAEVGQDIPAPTSIELNGTVAPDGAAEWWWRFDYFPRVATDQCNFPDPADLLNMESTATIHSTDQSSLVPVSATITGLPNETDYCFRLGAFDGSVNSETFFWSTNTISDPPLLENDSFDSSTNSVTYSVDITANTNWYIANVTAEYFAKGSESCGDYTGSVQDSEYWGEDSNGFSGFSSQTVGTTISGLETDTTYCFRLKSNNGHGEATPTAWTVVTTISPQPATVEGISLGLPITPGSAELALTMDDHGAAADEGFNSVYDIYLYDVGAGRCNSQDYFGGDMVSGWGGEFDGENPFSVEVSGLELGKPYCVTVFIESAWGGAYNAVVHEEVWFGEDPTASLGTNTATTDSITSTNGTVYPGYLATEYRLQYFPKQSGVACGDDTSTTRQVGSPATLSTNLDQSHLVTSQATGLQASTLYCFRLIAENNRSEGESSWDQIQTRPQPVQASITDLEVGPPGNTEESVGITAKVDEFGASADAGGLSIWRVQHYLLGAGSCNTAGIVGQTALATQSQAFTYDEDIQWDLVPANPGEELCVRVSVESAWDGMDNEAFLSFIVPQKPNHSGPSLSSTKTSVSVSAVLSATWTNTVYFIQTYPAVGSDCDVLGTVTTGSNQTFTPNTATGTITATQTGLDPDTLYCARIQIVNDYGVSGTSYDVIRTVEATPPSVPTGMAASNITQNSATLNWDASTDNAAIAGYRVREGATAVAEGPATSFGVSLTCGQSRTFTVIAIDTNGNESAASAPFTVTAAACPVEQPPAPPQAATCLVGFKQISFSGKLKGKKGKKGKYSVKVASKLAADRKSLKVTIKALGIQNKKVKVSLDGKRITASTTVTLGGTLRVSTSISKKTYSRKIGTAPC